MFHGFAGTPTGKPPILLSFYLAIFGGPLNQRLCDCWMFVVLSRGLQRIEAVCQDRTCTPGRAGFVGHVHLL